MYHLRFTSTFKKSYKRAGKRGKNLALLDRIIDRLRQGEILDRKYHDHALSGRLSDFRECHIQPDWLLVYKVEEDILTLTLTDTGSHADIFSL